MVPPFRPRTPNRALILTLFGVSLFIAMILSPFASSHPDGLDRVAQDLGFEQRASPVQVSEKLPFFGVFQGYQLRRVPVAIATPLAGLLGTGITFGLAWGLGKLATRRSLPKE